MYHSVNCKHSFYNLTGERIDAYIPLFLDRLITIVNDRRALNVDYLLRNTGKQRYIKFMINIFFENSLYK